MSMQTGYRLFLTKPVRLEIPAEQFANILASNANIAYYDSTLTGTDAMNIDYVAVVPRPTLIMTGDEPSAGSTGFVYKSGLGNQVNAGSIQAELSLSGDELFELAPNKMNTLVAYFCPGVDVDPVTTYQLTLSKIIVTPRYQLL